MDDKEKFKIKLIARVPLGKHFRNLEKKYEDKQNDQTRSILNSKQDYVTFFKRKSKQAGAELCQAQESLGLFGLDLN